MSVEPVRKVLLVDDEAALLNGLKKALRPYRDRWQVDTALGGAEAIAAIDRGGFDVIVSDARMPQIDGEQVLRHAQKTRPAMVRVVLSGQVDAKTGHRLASLAHQFLAKPSPGAAIIAAIEECCRVSSALGDPRLIELVGTMGALPVAPETYHHISGLIDSPSAAMEEVSQIVGENVAVATMLLKLVGSAYFGLQRGVTSVREAVVMLGLEAVREIVLLTEVLREPDGLGLLEELQRRAIFRSRLTRQIAGKSPTVTLASEAALLADVGVYSLALQLPARYRQVWERHLADRRALREIEEEVFGFDSDRVCAALLRVWRLPETVVTAVATGHRQPPADAVADAASVLALTTQLEDEVLGLRRTRDPGGLERLATQLGIAARLPQLREEAARAWSNIGSEEKR